MKLIDSYHTQSTLLSDGQKYHVMSLERLGRDLSHLPFSIRILLENLLRGEDGSKVTADQIASLLSWQPVGSSRGEIAFMPTRVLLQDFTGVPAVVDLAAMRDAMAAMGGDSARINPGQQVDLVIDHSVQVDHSGTFDALQRNMEREYERNLERYELLRWAQKAFSSFRVVPPGTGIVHQVNLEALASVVDARELEGEWWAFPDTLVGTDSHTTMINGLGVLGWGVGGIEAEAAMLMQPVSMKAPEVVGVRLTGSLQAMATATDLVLTITQMLRAKGVVGKFVEFTGPGLSQLPIADRATIANMAPEYGATVGYFPVDQLTLDYLRFTGRPEEKVRLVEAYTKMQGLFREVGSPEPAFSELLELDLHTVEPSLAGPKRPQDRVPLSTSRKSYRSAVVSLLGHALEKADQGAVSRWVNDEGRAAQVAPPGELARGVVVRLGDEDVSLRHGAVVIAAITSCTNTSNPALMVSAGLVARNAVRRGLNPKRWVKTSLAPGSQVVTDYLSQAGLLPYLEALRFHTVGYGCTTCIGNSGPLLEPVAKAVREHGLVVTSVLSGNRNFEGRINPLVRANYLCSPPLVVAYAIAGTMDIDFAVDPIAYDGNLEPVFLRELWPSPEEVNAVLDGTLDSGLFQKRYQSLFEGDSRWQGLRVPESDRFAWNPNSTYIRRPDYFDGMTLEPPKLTDIRGARVLALLGDSVTTDHISPAGSFAIDSEAGKYLSHLEVAQRDFNSYGARRGNHEVMVRGTLANIRLRNQLAPGTEGGFTTHLPSGSRMSIWQAAERYRGEAVPLVVIAGREYGTGSSRDWAAKGVRLLGVRAVIARSFERIHRSNLIGMGVLPLEFLPGEHAAALGLTGKERYHVKGNWQGLQPGRVLEVRVEPDHGPSRQFQVVCRLDTAQEVRYFEQGGILPNALRELLAPQP